MANNAAPGLRGKFTSWRQERQIRKKDIKYEEEQRLLRGEKLPVEYTAGGKLREKLGGFGKKPAAEPSGQTVAGMTGYPGFRMPGTSMMKQAGKGGAYVLLALLVGGIIFIGVFFVGGIFTALTIMPLYWLFIIIGIFLAILLGVKGKTGAAAAVLIFFIAFGGVSWYLQYTDYGQYLTGKAQVAGVGASQSLRAFTGPLNVMGQIFTGTYNPENLWSSDQVQSQYETVKDVGVTLLNVAPIRDEFDCGQQLVVQGRINAVAFPGQTATANLAARCASESVIPGAIECKNAANWDCTPEFHKIKEVRNRIFSCTHDATGEKGVFPVEITAAARDTVTVAGKQFVFANPDVAITLDNPLQTWHISKDSLKSWQKGDESLNLGVGVVGEPDYLEAGSNLDYYLGISLENPSSHTGTATITEVDLFVPKALAIDFAGSAEFGGKECPLATPDELSKIGIKTTGADLYLYKCKAGLVSGQILKPGDPHLNALLKFSVNKTKLFGADFGTFFVLATAQYDYENKNLIPLTVKDILATGACTSSPVEPSTGFQ